MCIFFFSSRRRHTRCSRDWSSDVCSSDLARVNLTWYSRPGRPEKSITTRDSASSSGTYARSEERRVGKSVDLGGRRIIKKRKKEGIVRSIGYFERRVLSDLLRVMTTELT